MTEFPQKIVVIGASSGIGREVALHLAGRGCRVGIAARREDRLAELVEQYPQNFIAHAIDVNDEGAPAALEALIEQLGGIDLLMYAAGVGKQNLELDPEPELATVNTNALGFTRIITAAFRYMAAHGGGHIAVITSIAGTKGLGVAPAYSATKAFENVYLEALEQQAVMRGLNIRITDLRPGFVATDLLNDGHSYPMLMDRHDVARHIVAAIAQRRHVRVIDWRWRIVTALWRLIPRSLWRHLPIRHPQQ